MVINKIDLQYSDVPADYEQTYTKLTRQGARVLALGLRQVGALTPQVRADTFGHHFKR